jgi:hypothetical protein
MQERKITFNGKTYTREVEMIGDVEKISWFNTTIFGFNEIFDATLLDELETYFVSECVKEMIPPKLYI